MQFDLLLHHYLILYEIIYNLAMLLLTFEAHILFDCQGV